MKVLISGLLLWACRKLFQWSRNAPESANIQALLTT